MSLEHELEAFTDYCTDKWNWFKRLPCTVKRAKYNRKAKQYNLYGNSEQEYITIDGVQYKIPDGYTLLEGITNTQDTSTSLPTGYVDTNIVYDYTNGLEVELEFTLTELSRRYCLLSNYQSAMSFSIELTGSNFGRAYVSLGSSAIDLTTTNTAIVGRNTLKVGIASDGTVSIQLNDGTVFTSTTTVTGTLVTDTPYVFVDRFLRFSTFSIPFEMNRIKYTEGGTVKNILIPVTNSSTNSMYDLINNTFLTKTGIVDAGLEAPTPTQPVEIESCGDYVGQKNQLVENGNFASTNWWSANRGTASYSNNIITITPNATGIADGRCGFAKSGTDMPSAISGHKYFFTIDINPSVALNNSTAFHLGNLALTGACEANVWNTLEDIKFIYNPSGRYVEGKAFGAFVEGSTVKFRNAMIIDLTQMFGEGNEPTTVADAKAKIAEVMGSEQDYYPYNAGTDYYKIPVIAGSNCGCVDLGSLNWNRSTSYSHPFFYLSISSKASGSISNGFISKYPYTSDWNVGEAGVNFGSKADDKSYALCSVNNQIFIRDDSYTSTTAFKQAMQGVYFYYQRTTDTSWTAPTITNCYLSAPLRKVGSYIDKIHFGTGNNLLNLNATNTSNGYKAGYYQDSTGTEVANSSYNISEYIPVLPETTYYYAIDGVDTTGKSGHNAPRPAFYSSSKTYLSSLSTILNFGASFTTPANCYFVRLPLYTQYLSEEMFIEGSTAPTKYESYSDTPQVIRNVGSYTFDGTETWNSSSTANCFYSTTTNYLTYSKNANTKMLWENYKYNGTVSGSPYYPTNNCSFNIWIGEFVYEIYAKNTDCTTVSDFQDTVLNSNIIYPLATSTSEVISLPTLTPASGTTIYTVPTTVQPFVSVNLFDKDNVNWIYNSSYSNNYSYINLTNGNIGSAVATNYEINRTFYIPIQPSTSYTVTFGNTTYTKRIGTYATKPVVGSTTSNYQSAITANTATITSGASDYYLVVQLYIDADYNSGARSANIIPSVQIQEGSSATTYEPYCNGMEVQASTNK